MDSGSFCIYGAGIVATSIYKAIKTVYGQKPLFFLVSDAEKGKEDENPRSIDGISVLRFSGWQEKLRKNREYIGGDGEQDAVNFFIPDKYLVAVPEVHHSSIRKWILTAGILEENIILITSEIENYVMEKYYRFLYPKRTVLALLDEPLGNGQIVDEVAQNLMAERENEVQVFQAKCHVDRPLACKVHIPKYVVPIQVGAVLTDRNIEEVQDSMGDNISFKNRNYCELTATYYAWKHSGAAYKGLCHYRRIFDITEDQMKLLLDKEEEWDVILPYPSVHYPDISTQHVRYLRENDWQAMKRAVKEVAPEYLEAYETAVKAGEQHFFNFNMLIAKARIFDDYCNFLFSVLEKAEELTLPKGWERADRFAGYMGENLTTIYFTKNRETFKILYSGKKWII